MTFGSTFGRTFSPTFQPSSQAAAAGGWWDLNGTLTSCVAAYQPKGAASYAASKVNLTGNTSYDATEGTAPDWDTSTGWNFNGTDDHLLAGYSAALKPVTMIARINPNTTLSSSVFGSASPTTGGGSLLRFLNTGKLQLLKSNIAVIGTSTGAIAIDGSADSVIACTYSSDGDFVFYIDGSSSGTGTNDQTFVASTGVIGAFKLSATVYSHFKYLIKALAVYDTVLTPTQVSNLTTAMAAL